jgi:hypothetical protein
MRDERADLTYDFTHKAGDLLHASVHLPGNAPVRFKDEVVLFNEANNAEKRYDARTGRTLRCSLPNELPINENVKIAKEISEIFTALGMCVFAVIHEGKNLDDPAKNNPHAHILLTDRPVDKNGFLPTKSRAWIKNNVRDLREQIERTVNCSCERNKLKVRFTCQSLEAQGIKRKPQINIGRAAWEMERRGATTLPGEEYRKIVARNEMRQEQERQRERESELEMSQDYELSR